MATDLTTRPTGLTPYIVTPPILPGAIMQVGQSGRITTRSQAAGGHRWTESYRFGMVSPLGTSGRGAFAKLLSYYRNGTFLHLRHPMYLTELGAGGGTPVVSGADQTGSTLDTSGWPNNTNVLDAGDLILTATYSQVYQVTADVTSNGSGLATLSISPPIFDGQSPSNGAAITITSGVYFTAVIVDLQVKENMVGEIQEITATFQESPE